MSTTYAYSSTLVVMECCNCHMAFAVTPEFDRERLADHGSFCCPAGHRQSYTGRTEAQKLRDELAARDRSLEAARSLARRERERRESADRRRAAAQGQVTKIKNRVSRGVCPCCNRTFADLARHMAGQHPDFAPITSAVQS